LVKRVDDAEQEVQYGDDEEAGREAPLHEDEAHHGNHGDASGGQQVVEEIRVVAGGLPGRIEGENSVGHYVGFCEQDELPWQSWNATERRHLVRQTPAVSCYLYRVPDLASRSLARKAVLLSESIETRRGRSYTWQPD
jgi:hypothetical protein